MAGKAPAPTPNVQSASRYAGPHIDYLESQLPASDKGLYVELIPVQVFQPGFEINERLGG